MIKKSIKIATSVLILLMILLLQLGCSNEEKSTNGNQNDMIENYSKENTNLSKTNIKLLSSLKDYAKDGMINKYKFKIGDTIDSVYNLWGAEDEMNYVEKAKGTYSTYSKQNVVFGYNKGSQIFEIRSYNKGLKYINLRAIKEVYKEPEYNVINSQNQRVVGYKVNEEYKIEFVLTNPKGKDNQQFVDHYGVFCSKLTRNNMADDPGREW